MNIKNIIVGILSIIIAVLLFSFLLWAGVIFVVLAFFFVIYVRIRTFFAMRKVHKEYGDIEAEYDEEADDVVLVTAPDGTTEKIHLENSSEKQA
jgi:hypothetical protein